VTAFKHLLQLNALGIPMQMRVRLRVTPALLITTHLKVQNTALPSHLATKSMIQFLPTLKFALTRHTVAGVKETAQLAQMDSFAPKEANSALNGITVALVAHTVRLAFRQSARQVNLA